jgi:nucleotide-binding universal stress UspA family protein
MVSEARDGLLTLWATQGTPDALVSVATLKRWVLPGTKRLQVLSVAPIGRSLSRMVRWTTEQRADDIQEAEAAARASIEALGETDVPIETQVRWGAASHEIAQQAEDARADLLVLGAGSHGALHKAVLGGTAEQALFETTKSVLIARDTHEETEQKVTLVYTSQRLLTNALEMFRDLKVAADVRLCIVALLEPVKPFGSMFITLNEDIRAREQVAHDAQVDLLRDHLSEVATRIAGAETRVIETSVMDCEPRDTARCIEEMRSALVIVGDSTHGDPTSPERRTVAQLASKLSCPVLVAR